MVFSMKNDPILDSILNEGSSQLWIPVMRNEWAALGWKRNVFSTYRAGSCPSAAHGALWGSLARIDPFSLLLPLEGKQEVW